MRFRLDLELPDGATPQDAALGLATLADELNFRTSWRLEDASLFRKFIHKEKELINIHGGVDFALNDSHGKRVTGFQGRLLRSRHRDAGEQVR